MSNTWSRLTQKVARPWFGPLVIALLATAVVSTALDPAGDYPSCFEGPGLTIDEIFNVSLGASLADRILTGDVAGAIRVGQTLPDHPPLGRLWLGLFHELVILVVPPRGEHAPLVVAAARFGSAVAFGILVWLIGFSAARWFGNLAGWGAAIGLVLMPRSFGHAHLAALETVLNLTYTVAVLSVARRWSNERAPALRSAAICGIWLGLALLTKIQAIFIPIPIAVWALINWRHRALLPLLIWGLVGLWVFVCGWPWLWLDPVGNLLKYLGHASERSSIQVWYWGRVFADNDVPWHYPWVLFITTVPIGLHALGLWGVLAGHQSPTAAAQRPPVAVEWLLLGSLLFPLIVFSIPGVAVYDGERLFLIVFPLWALFIGRGFAALGQWLGQRMPQWSVACLLTVFLATQSVGLWQLAPCWLSYYNATVGGLSGAEKLGFQRTYWGDGLTRELWNHTAAIPANSVIDVAPVLHQFQLESYESQCPMLRQRGLRLQAFDRAAPAPYLVVFFRQEYLPEDWISEPPRYRRMAVVIRQGMVLTGLYQRLPD